MPISSFAKWKKDMEKQGRQEGRKITPDEIKTAYDMGAAAYKGGTIRAPVQDQKFHNMIFKVEGGDKLNHYWRIDMMKSWSKGYHDANASDNSPLNAG